MILSGVICRQVNLYDARKRQSRNHSRGMRCWLLVAMACIGNPDILILDEPTTGLDPVSRRQVGVAVFVGFQENNVTFGVLVNVFPLSHSLSLFFLGVLIGVGGDRESEARS